MINEQAAFVLTGMNELTDKLIRWNAMAINILVCLSFAAVFKAGTVHLTPIDRQKHFDAFFEDVQDMELRILLVTSAVYGIRSNRHLQFLEPCLSCSLFSN